MDELMLLRELDPVLVVPSEARERARAAIGGAALRRRRRRLVASAVAVAAVGVVSGAYGVVHDLVVGAPAPPEVRSQQARFGHRAELIPVPHPDEPQLREARVAAVLDSSVGRVYLFASPNARGSCVSTWIEGDRGYQGRLNMTSACGPPGRSYYLFGEQRYRGRRLVLAAGEVSARVARVGLLVGGREVRVPLTGRYFLAELPEHPEGFAAYAADGSVVEQRRQPRFPPHGPAIRPPHQVTRARQIAVVHARGGIETLRLYVGRASDGGYCQIVRSDRRASNRSCSVRSPAPRALGVGAMNFGGAPGGVLVLVGPVGSAVARLTLVYEDGREIPVALRHGWVLQEISRRDYVRGRRPTKLVAADAHGHVVATMRLPWATR